MPRILVINPNSNDAVTTGISQALDEFRHDDGREIDCITLHEGPFGIESQADIEAVEPLLIEAMALYDDYDAYVIACYSDPGLALCRAISDRPVFGIQESAVHTAMELAAEFGVAAISDASIARHLIYLNQMGVADRLAAERPLNMSVAETGSDQSLPVLTKVASQLRDEDGAGAIILGCTGMAPHRAILQETLGIPVIDPTRAAVAMALKEQN
jgi:Asp/Glu/hydantoin racemase